MSEYMISLADIQSTENAQLRPAIKSWLDCTDYLHYWSPLDDKTHTVPRNIALLASKIGEICGRCSSVHPGVASLHQSEHCKAALAFNGFQAPQNNTDLVVCCICQAQVNKGGEKAHMMIHTFIQKFLAGCAAYYYSERLETSK